MANILLPTGKIEFCNSASAGCREKTVVAGKDVSIKKVNSGFEGNCIDFGVLCFKYEYGNLSPERLKEVLITIAKDGFLDLSDIKYVDKIKDIPSSEEYVYFHSSENDAFSRYMNPPCEAYGIDDEEEYDVDEEE